MKLNMRRKVIAGNWKMNMLPNEAINFIENLAPLVKDTENEVILCVPYTDLFYSLLTAQGTNIKIGAQNMHWEESGAYTGEVSAKMLKSIGVEYVIIGHSERRAYFAETDETVNKKIKSALANGLTPIVCVGETLEQREKGITEEIISQQIEKAFEGISSEDSNKIIVAYEPIWAIGTGKTATKEQANETIKQIRNKLVKIYGQNVADEITIQYGGSVKSSNAKELFEMSDIDGGLVGGASLDAKEFSNIVNFDVQDWKEC
jgi:triosephosphate isomerase